MHETVSGIHGTYSGRRAGVGLRYAALHPGPGSDPLLDLSGVRRARGPAGPAATSVDGRP